MTRRECSAVGVLRRCLAVALCAALTGWGQQVSIEPLRPSAPSLVRPYLAPTVPPVRLDNSPRLKDLIRAGMLYLTAQDAIALALENNIDLEIARYNPIMAAWRVERAQAGGALPGVPSAASQAGSVAAGQGVTGSQAAAGVRAGGAGASAGGAANATIAQIGPVTQTLDPSIQEASTFSHTSTPQPNLVQSATPVLVSDTRAHTGTLQQGFLTGGSISVRYAGNYLKENSPTDVLNPSSATNLSISAQHNLLRGLGIAVNGRTITVAKMNLGTSDLNFRTQVIAVATQVLNLYYALAAGYEDMRAKRNAAEVAQTFVANVKEQIEVGTLAPPDAYVPEAQLASSQQAFADSQASLQQQEIRLKNLLSRNGTGDPLVAAARIVPVDRIVIPDQDDVPPIEDMVKRALANRADLAAEKAGEAAARISALGTRNGILPNLQVFGAMSAAGLAGTPVTVTVGPLSETADPYFAGGVGTALGQVFRRNFPTQRIGAFFQAPLRNRQAQADYAIDELQLRQTQLSLRKDLDQVEVVVRNYVVALQQARARHEAAVRNRVLQRELLTSEQKKYALGASTPYNVTQVQRDLMAAQSAEVSALVAYSTARIALDQALGATLEANHISIAEARGGEVKRTSSVPAAPPNQP